MVSPDSVWYALVLLLFSASAATGTGSKSFECALVSTMETYHDPAVRMVTIVCINVIIWVVYHYLFVQDG